MAGRKWIAATIAVVAVLRSAAPTAAADAEVKGYTLQVAEVMGRFEYQPLPRVKIKAFRGGPIWRMPEQSEQNGFFHFNVPEGAPFGVVFYLDRETVPVLQNLAGASGIHHDVSVGLLTVTQYRMLAEARKVPPLEKYVQAILDQIPPDEEVTPLLKEMLGPR